MDNLNCIEGVFKIIIFQSNQYKVARFLLNGREKKMITVTGYMGDLLEDTQYRLEGEYKDHPRYGMQFNVLKYERILPNDDDSLVHYFSSATFHGIGKRTAEKIVAFYGKDVISILRENPDKVNEMVGLTPKQRQSLINGIMDDDSSDETIVFLTQFGIPLRIIMGIKDTYEKESLSLIKENPYRLMYDFDGIGFKTCDKIASHLGIEKMDASRVKAFISSCLLEEAMKTGNTYTTYQEFLKILQHNGFYVEEEDLQSYLNELVMERQIYIDGTDLYSISQYDAEKGIADFFAFYPYEEDDKVKRESVESSIKQVEELFNIQYEEKQKEAIYRFFEESFSIITGGPGTGKTTIVRGILSIYRSLYPSNRIGVCAPTGRAAKRLGELAQVDACTIHSLLKWNLEDNSFGINEEEPLDLELLIIDEFSMVDSYLFYNVLKASRYIKKILIIGDEDQLPSVGPGFVLKDLIHSECFALTRLEKIFRQKEGSDVITLADQIKNGNCDILKNGEEVKLFSCLNYQVKDILLKILTNAFDKGYSIDDVQVLAPMYKGVAGIETLNNALQELCNPRDMNKKELKVGYQTFREGDKVLQLKNQPDDNVFNGDIGKIIEIIDENEDYDHQNRIVCQFDDAFVEYTKENFNCITHAYCISIHKSQGSEYPIVIMPILKDYQFMLQRRLIYTGITRAKKSLVLLGDEEMLIKGINREERFPRKTKLEARLRNQMDNFDLNELSFEY